jgi:hypothetical protein
MGIEAFSYCILNIIMGKISDLSNFELGMIVGARRSRFSISETAALIGFFLDSCHGWAIATPLLSAKNNKKRLQ